MSRRLKRAGVYLGFYAMVFTCAELWDVWYGVPSTLLAIASLDLALWWGGVDRHG